MPRIFSWDLEFLQAPYSLNNFQIEHRLSIHSLSFVLYIDCFACFIIADTLFRKILKIMLYVKNENIFLIS